MDDIQLDFVGHLTIHLEKGITVDVPLSVKHKVTYIQLGGERGLLAAAFNYTAAGVADAAFNAIKRFHESQT